jgi:glycosyltransferase involved in cell wall biosynthesis
LNQHEALNGMIFMTDSPTDLLLKGEITPTYFNPDGVFKCIDFVLNYPKEQDRHALEKMVGGATIRIFYLNLPSRYFLKSLGWREKYLERKAREFISQKSFVRPDIIRAFNPFVEAGIAAHVAKATSTPFVISLHGAYDIDPITTSKAREIVIKRFKNDLARRIISSADLTVGVYLDASNYGKRMGAIRIETIYNAVSKPSIKPKGSSRSHEPSEKISLISVNRQDPLKNPINIVRAMSHLVNAELLLVGKGTMSNSIRLEIEKRGLTDRITLLPSLDNAELLELVQDSDIYVATCHYGGLSKGTIEAALMGKPIVLNLNKFEDNELEGDWLVRCNDSEEGYAKALQDLICNFEKRSTFAKRALQFAIESFDPARLNSNWFNLYHEIVVSSRTSQR